MRKFRDTRADPAPERGWLAVRLAAIRPGLRSSAEFLFPLLLIGVLWELLVASGLIRSPYLPAPTEILRRMIRMAASDGLLWRHLGMSLRRMLLGYLLASAAGVMGGVALGLSLSLRRLFLPLLNMLMSVPTIAWVPVLLLTLGLGDRTVIAAVFLGAYFVTTFNTLRGIEMIPPSTLDAARIAGSQGIHLLRSVLLPASLVSLLAGLRLGIAYAWRALVGGEMLSALVTWGLGRMIYQARFWNDVTVMFVGLLLIGAVSLVFDRGLLSWLERRTVERWGMISHV